VESDGAEYQRSAPLAPVYLLIEYGLWLVPAEERDTTNDVSDEDMAKWL